MAIKIIIRRRVPKGREGDLLPSFWNESKATVRPGYISANAEECRRPGGLPGVSTWHSVDDWKTWERVTPGLKSEEGRCTPGEKSVVRDLFLRLSKQVCRKMAHLSHRQWRGSSSGVALHPP